MKMTAFALAGNIGFLGAIGLTNAAGILWPSPAAARLKNPSRSSNPVRASPPNPAPDCQRNSRRVRPQNWPWGLPFITPYLLVASVGRAVPDIFADRFRRSGCARHLVPDVGGTRCRAQPDLRKRLCYYPTVSVIDANR